MENEVVPEVELEGQSTGASGKPKWSRKRKIVIGVIAFILIFSVVSLLVTKVIYDNNFGRADTPEYTANYMYDDITEYERHEVNFMSGKNTLAGYIYGEENDKGLVVIAHGLGGGAESYLAETMYFVDNGWRVFAYDCTGSYNSEGKGTKGLPQSAIDLDAALGYIESQNWGLPVCLYGHSWGGYAVTAVLNYSHDVTAVASIAGYNTPFALLHEQSQSMMGWFATLTYPFEWAYQTMLFGKAANLSAVDGINSSGVPVMIIHGTGDEVVLYDGASIMAHSGKITNPNAVCVIYNAENHDGHTDLFISDAAVEYRSEKTEEYTDLYNEYSGYIPDEVLTEFYSTIDKSLWNELDTKFMDDINSFFEEQLIWKWAQNAA